MRRWSLLTAAVCVGWGTIPLVVRHVQASSVVVAFSRVSVAMAGLGAVLAVEQLRGGGDARPRLLSVQPARCGLTAAILGLHWLALIAAYRAASAGTVILVVYMAPVAVAALAPRFLGEPLARRTVVALGLAVLGFGLLAGPAADRAGVRGLALSTAAMATFVALVLLSKPLAEAYGGLRLAFMEMVGATVVLLPVVLAAGPALRAADVGWLLLLGLGHTALGIVLYLSALGHLPATRFSILGYLEPVAVVVFAWVVVAESPGAASMMGGVLVIAAGLLVVSEPAPEGAVGVPG